MKPKVSVKISPDIDAPNAYYVSIDGEDDITVHTDKRGNGLWIDGKQVVGTSQFNGGKDVSASIRRYFTKVYFGK